VLYKYSVSLTLMNSYITSHFFYQMDADDIMAMMVQEDMVLDYRDQQVWGHWSVFVWLCPVSTAPLS